MIKVVPDTNVIIASFLGAGGPKRWIINLALDKRITLYGSAKTYAEFQDVISREKFRKYLSRQIYTVEKLDHDYRAFINIVDTEGLYPDPITKDPDDDEFYRVAKASGARLILSADAHLHDVKKYDGIIVATAKAFTDAYGKSISKTEPPS